ncbi:MAG: thiamine-phosphate kinase [Planctomycetota bacterium]|jgi:thiamine-monophosphate kinase
MNELELISWLKKNLKQGEGVIKGPGDDCAILDVSNYQNIAVTTDTLLEGTHFSKDEDGFAVGRKTVAVNLSDMAAMGCKPLWAVTGLGLKRDSKDKWLDDFASGLIACTEEYSVSLVGGDFTKGDGPTSITLTVIGIPFAEKAVYRSGAEDGDLIVATGTLGGSIKGKHLSFTPRVAESEWLCTNAKPNAMMDISDGLALDLRRLCSDSAKGAVVEEAEVPVSADASELSSNDIEKAFTHALSDGEDFELLFTVSEDKWVYIKENWPFDCKISAVGRITSADKEIKILKNDGTKYLMPKGGYIHE